MLHAIAEKSGVTLPVKMDAVQITIRKLKPLGEYKVFWPFVPMKSWAALLLKDHPRVLLGGHQLWEVEKWQATFSKFWSLYESCDGDHPVFESGLDKRYVVPYMLHGDEGRGLSKTPYLVTSWQPIISHLGMGSCNDSTTPI